MGEIIVDNGLYNFKIDRAKQEELHLLLVADYGDGYFTLFSKRIPGEGIYYKMTYQEGEEDEILHEGNLDSTKFNRFVEDYESEVLRPAGSHWQEIKPFVVKVEDSVEKYH